MKINGVGLEPHECNDEFLSKRLGINKAAIIFAGVIMGLIVLVGLILFFNTLVTADFENALPFLVMIPVFCLIFGIPICFVFRETQAIQKELNKRSAVDDEDALNIKEATKKNTRRSLLAIICIVVIAVIVIFAIVDGSIGNNNTGSNSGEKCRNCGRKTDLVAGFGYCYDCYEGFVDWQEDNWKEN